ncbi:MAG TPA: hypothetical protein VGQ34_03120 [Sphingomicrobium sp.]|nr:hypothetical protein [Sphingomicrobium sp.]
MRSFRRLLASFLAFSLPRAAAPFERARTIDGAPFDANGKVTIVQYWAICCALFRIEIPRAKIAPHAHQTGWDAALIGAMDAP